MKLSHNTLFFFKTLKIICNYMFIFLSTGLWGFIGKQTTVSCLLVSAFTKLSAVPAPLKCSGNTCGAIRDFSIGYRLPWWLRQYRIHLQCSWPTFNPLVRKIPQRRERQPPPVFLSGEFHGHRRLQSTRSQRIGHDWVTYTSETISVFSDNDEVQLRTRTLLTGNTVWC